MLLVALSMLLTLFGRTSHAFALSGTKRSLVLAPFTTTLKNYRQLSLLNGNQDNSEGEVNNSTQTDYSDFRLNKIDGTDYQQSSSANQPTKTGWTHSTPSPDSDFWEPGPEAVRDTTQEPQKFRTGWIHNKKPPKPKQTASSTSTSDTASKATGPTARQMLEQAKIEGARNHRIINTPTFIAGGFDNQLAVTEHYISVPLSRDDNANDNNKRIDLYFTIVEKVTTREYKGFLQQLSQRSPSQRARDYVKNANLNDATKMILYLQGGPGYGSPTPHSRLGLSKGSSWASAAFEQGYERIVLMDQRGTGSSTPITKQTLQRKFPSLFLLDNEYASSYDGTSDPAGLNELKDLHPEESDKVQAAVEEATDYLSQFRAPQIVQDAEGIREALLQPVYSDSNDSGNKDSSVRPWGCSLGQSFGGFITLTYLSQVEHPPQICLLTGGIAPILTPIDEAYSSLWDRVKKRSLQYYETYPDDVALVQKLVRMLIEKPVPMPAGGVLTARRLLQLGLKLGGSPTSFASLHSQLNSALVEDGYGEPEWSRGFLKEIELEQSFDEAPIYFWLHEPIYCDGPDHSPTNWSAHRVYNEKVEQDETFDYRVTSRKDSTLPVIFFGEHVFPWMSYDYAELRGVGLTAMAQALAEKADWSQLYDTKRIADALESEKSWAAAAVYVDDMYVDFECCRKVLDGPLAKCKAWITNDYQHSGLRDGGDQIMKKIYNMATGCQQTPS